MTIAGTFDAVVALGANLGDRRQALELACRRLEAAGLHIVRRSRLYWSRPWGVTDQPDFLNAAVTIRSPLRPLQILDLLLAVERRQGRRRGDRHWGPRTLDLDLLSYRWVRHADPRLTLPHPRIAQRDFVLAPLADLDVPPIPSLAPAGWRACLARLAPDQRTLIHSIPWR